MSAHCRVQMSQQNDVQKYFGCRQIPRKQIFMDMDHPKNFQQELLFCGFKTLNFAVGDGERMSPQSLGGKGNLMDSTTGQNV